jgi:hypothetical protein
VRISSSVRARQVSQGFINVLQEWSPMPLVGSSRLEFLLVHAIKLFVGATQVPNHCQGLVGRAVRVGEVWRLLLPHRHPSETAARRCDKLSSRAKAPLRLRSQTV